MTPSSAIAIAAHPDDIEIMMAGTLCLLRAAGYRTHYLNISSGSCGSMVHRAPALRRLRRREAKNAAARLGACFHEGRTDDFEILYTLPLLRWLVGIVREVRPGIVLTHSPDDYMEDHVNTCRLAVSAAFARGMPNFRVEGNAPAWSGEVAVYHAMPVGFCDGLGRHVAPAAFVDVGSVYATKLEALGCHQSQAEWLRANRGVTSLAAEMERRERQMGVQSGRFELAEGWRQHSTVGFGPAGADPLRAALGGKFMLNPDYGYEAASGAPAPRERGRPARIRAMRAARGPRSPAIPFPV